MPEALENFANAARRYCAWCEGTPSDESGEARAAFAHLTELVCAVLPLPVGPGGGDAPEIPDDAWKRMHARFGSLPFQYYASPLDPLSVEPQEPGIGDLCDDLADIWRDLKSGLWLYDHHDVNGAAHDWRYLYQIHWGSHATAAMHALHYWLVQNGES